MIYSLGNSCLHAQGKTFCMVQTNAGRQHLCANGPSPREVLTNSQRGLVVETSQLADSSYAQKRQSMMDSVMSLWKPEDLKWGDRLIIIEEVKMFGLAKRKSVWKVVGDFYLCQRALAATGLCWCYFRLQPAGGTKLMEQNSWRRHNCREMNLPQALL